jgi:hypothetical protein
MKIKKNGKVINLTESDLRRIVKRVISEQESIVQGEHDMLDNLLKNVSGSRLKKALEDCGHTFPAECKAANIVPNEKCAPSKLLKKHAKCLLGKLS